MEALQRFILLKNNNDPKSFEALKQLKFELLSFQTLPPSKLPPSKQEYNIYRMLLTSQHSRAVCFLLS